MPAEYQWFAILHHAGALEHVHGRVRHSCPTSYNRLALKFLRLSAILLLSTAAALAQAPANTGLNILVVPFENQSQAPGIAWIGDSFPELMQERLNSAKLFVLPREDRIRAYDRLGIPVEVHPSRATLYRIAEQLDVDYAVLGLYRFDGRTFTATVQLLDMRRQHLSPEMNESGPLIQLIDIQTALAWDILHALRPDITVTKQAFVTAAPPIRFDYLLDCLLYYFPALSDQRAIKVFDGSDSSTSFFAVSMPATGSFFGSSSPIWTSTEA